jgi:hypothetical protein
MKPKATPVQELLKELLDFNEDTGILTWKARDRRHFNSDGFCKSWNTRYAGKQAGGKCPNGYLYITFGRARKDLVSRVIWKYVYGVDAQDVIDHIDGNPLNNRLSNLREATTSQSIQNTRLRKDNISGYKGVSKTTSGKHMSRIKIKNKVQHLGSYDTPEEAHAVYCEAADRLFKEFANYG